MESQYPIELERWYACDLGDLSCIGRGGCRLGVRERRRILYISVFSTNSPELPLLGLWFALSPFTRSGEGTNDSHAY